jgi:hypothetical protein
MIHQIGSHTVLCLLGCAAVIDACTLAHRSQCSVQCATVRTPPVVRGAVGHNARLDVYHVWSGVFRMFPQRRPGLVSGDTRDLGSACIVEGSRRERARWSVF